MIKDMTNEALAAHIHDLRVLLNNAANLGAAATTPAASKRAARNTGWMLKQLDISIAVKRQRECAGTWITTV